MKLQKSHLWLGQNRQDRKTDAKQPFAFRAVAVAAALTLTVCLVACGGSSTTAMDSATDTQSSYGAGAYKTEQYNLSEGMEPEVVGDSTLGEEVSESATAETSRKIIYTANMSLEATDFEQAHAKLNEAVEAAGGYYESTSLSGKAEAQNRYASFTVRVPLENYRSFLSAASGVASVQRQGEDAQDITSNYIDVEARLYALQQQRDRLNALADSAETTADLLEIESQLSDVQYQLEDYTRQLRAMNDQITYCTVQIDLNEVASLTPVGTNFGEKIGRAFWSGWNAFIDFIQGLVLVIVFLLPLLVVVAIVVVIVVLLVRGSKKHRASHPKQPKQQAAPSAPAAPLADKQAKTAQTMPAPDSAPKYQPPQKKG